MVFIVQSERGNQVGRRRLFSDRFGLTSPDLAPFTTPLFSFSFLISNRFLLLGGFYR